MDAPARGDASAASDEVLLALLVLGPVGEADLSVARPWLGGMVETISRLERGELVERAARGRVRLTARGRHRAGEIRDSERRELGARAEALDAGFRALNARLKAALLSWQVRRVGPADVPNDHADPGYDARVVAEIDAVIRAAVSVLAPLAATRARFSAYGERLLRAVERSRGGAGAFVAGAGCDSVHTVWWQLHAEILCLLGRERGADEV